MNKQSPGKFITLEGGEGVGKSTNLEFIRSYLQERLAVQNIDLLLTREPGGTPLAEEIRELIIQPRDEAVSSSAELLLVFAARAQHLNELILPALKNGLWILSDRFTDATFAYQGGGRGLQTSTIQTLEELVQEGLQPDLTILLDLDVTIGMNRATARNQLDRIEDQEISFFESVRKTYLERARLDPNRFRIVDASQDLSKVQADISDILEQFLRQG